MNSIAVVVAALLFLASRSNRCNPLGKTVSVNLSLTGGGDFGTTTVLVGASNNGNFFGNTCFDLNGGVNGDDFI